MKRLFICVAFIVAATLSNAQSDSSLISLERRLNDYMKLNKELDFERLFDYIHPNIYKVAPRNQLVEAFKKVFNNDEVALGIDSIRKKKVSESFLLNGAAYRKVDYYMVMWMKTKDESSMDDSSFVELMLTGLKEELAGKDISFDTRKKTFMIRGDDKLIAIKDTPGSVSDVPWLPKGKSLCNQNDSRRSNQSFQVG